MRKFIVIDTETTPWDKGLKNPNPDRSSVYDLGFMVCDRAGNIYETHSFVISEVFRSSLMNNAFYHSKLPQYYAGLCFGEWQELQKADAIAVLQDCIKRYNVRDLWAYNCNFDRRAMQATFGNWLPNGIRFRDIWNVAGATICNSQKYVRYCIANDYFTPTGNPKTNAEIVYRYYTNDNDFTERHTALNDCTIELQLLLGGLKYHWKYYQGAGQGWRHAARVAAGL